MVVFKFYESEVYDLIKTRKKPLPSALPGHGRCGG